MANKYMVLTFPLLFSVSVSQSMFKHKDKKPLNQDNKTEVQGLDDVQKMREAQLRYRGKNSPFKDESNSVKIEIDEKK